MTTEIGLTKTYRISTSVLVGKFTAAVVDSSVYPTEGCRVGNGANDGPVAGIFRESILPDNVQDYSGGQYVVASGTAWPSVGVVIPGSSNGMRVSVQKGGIIRAVAGAAIARGQRCNIADAQGRLKPIAEVAGTLVYEVGEAETPAAGAGSVFRVRLTLIQYKT